jgi:predicted enzyme related to lactoylglutathione lyase
MIRKIATVGVYVTDQAGAKEFWTKRVGFELRRETPMGPGGSWLEVAPPKAESCLVIYPRAMMENWAELKPSIVFECDDCAAAYEEMKARGVKFVDAPKSMPWGTFAKFVDEDGNEFLLKGPPR